MEHLFHPPSNREAFRRVARCRHGAVEWLEPDAGRPARPVLRGRRGRNAPLLPDQGARGIRLMKIPVAGENLLQCLARSARLRKSGDAAVDLTGSRGKGRSPEKAKKLNFLVKLIR